MRYGKLVRDRIPELISSNGGTASTHIAGAAEYRRKLREKLMEEAGEYLDDPNTEELADILEIVQSLARVHKISPARLERLRAEKAKRRGSFTKRIILDSTRR